MVNSLEITAYSCRFTFVNKGFGLPAVPLWCHSVTWFLRIPYFNGDLSVKGPNVPEWGFVRGKATGLKNPYDWTFLACYIKFLTVQQSALRYIILQRIKTGETLEGFPNSEQFASSSLVRKHFKQCFKCTMTFLYSVYWDQNEASLNRSRSRLSTKLIVNTSPSATIHMDLTPFVVHILND